MNAPLDTLPRLGDRSIDPVDDTATVIGWPGRRLPPGLDAGDVVIIGQGGRERYAILMSEALRAAAPGAAPGHYADVVDGLGVRGLRRVAGPDGLLLGDTMIVRALSEADAETPSLPPLPPPGAVTHPTIRQGSRGPAVREAQMRLNGVDTALRPRGARLDRCPLALDGVFGPDTRAATLSFQHVAFPGDYREWDGVIGPHTWAALVAFDRPPVPVPPFPPVPPPDGPPSFPPIVPVVDREIDWGTLLTTAPGVSSNAILRTGNAVKPMIDGDQTFRSMIADMDAASGEGDFIYLLGWDCFDDFELIPGRTFRDVYTAAAARNVEVAAMIWDSPVFIWDANLSAPAVVARINALPGGKAIEDDETVNKTPGSRARLAAAVAAAVNNPLLVPIIIAMIEPDLARLFGSHHQKLLVVRRGGTLIGYCGGVDLNPNRIMPVTPRSGQPHHDTHCRIVGPSAHDLLTTFLRRWEHHPRHTRFAALRGAGVPLPAPLAAPAADDAPFGPTSTIVARTFNPVHASPPLTRERDIKPMLLAAITAAQRFIYCEDQYMIDLDTADALNAALRKPTLAHVTILIPATILSDVPFSAEYRFEFVERARRGLTTAQADKLAVFVRTSVPGAAVFGPHTYVHSKSWVFDDELAVIGTANCNRRSYTYDSEVDAFIFNAPGTGRIVCDTAGVTFAQRYRMGLWEHHLGINECRLIDGAASGQLWRAGRRPASATVFDFDHRPPTPSARFDVLKQRARAIAAPIARDFIDPVP